MESRITIFVILSLLCGSLRRTEATDTRPLAQLLKILPLLNASISEDQLPAEQVPINLPPLTENVQNLPEINYIEFLRLTTAKRTNGRSEGWFQIPKHVGVRSTPNTSNPKKRTVRIRKNLSFQIRRARASPQFSEPSSRRSPRTDTSTRDRRCSSEHYGPLLSSSSAKSWEWNNFLELRTNELFTITASRESSSYTEFNRLISARVVE